MKPENKKALKSIFFDVRKEEASKFVKDLGFTKNRSHFIIAETPEGPYVVNSCSPTYELINNEELITPVVESLESEYDIIVKARHSNYSRFFVDFLIKDHAIDISTGKKKELVKDEILPRIRMNNSYDGGMKYSYEFGFHRVVCSNGLTAPIGKTHKQKMMHTPSAGNGNALNNTLNAITEFIETAKDLSKGYQPLMQNRLTIAQANEKIAQIVEELKYPKKQMEAATARLQTEANMGYQVNDFLVYNALNFALHQNDSKMKEHKKQGMDEKVLNFLLNNAA